jgi:hypothetical protein
LPPAPRRTPPSLLWALPKLGAAPLGSDAVGLLMDEAAAQAPAFTNRQLAQSAWALAKLSPPGAPPPPRAFADRLWHQAHLRAGRLAPGEVTLIIMAAARLGLADAPPAWLARELSRAAAGSALAGAPPERLAAALGALAQLGRKPPAAWLDAFWVAADPAGFDLQVGPGAAGLGCVRARAVRAAPRRGLNPA